MGSTFRLIIASVLSIASVVATLAHASSPVVCYESNGTVNVESAAEVAACHSRYSLAHTAAPESGPQLQQAHCVDIPLESSAKMSSARQGVPEIALTLYPFATPVYWQKGSNDAPHVDLLLAREPIPRAEASSHAHLSAVVLLI